MSSLVNIFTASATPWNSPQRPKPEDRGTVGPDPVLDERGLLPFHPGVEPCQVQHREENEARQDELDDHVFHHGAAASVLAPETELAGVI